jgi:hypothetical protein
VYLVLALAIVGVPTSAEAGRTFYGWLYGHEVLPEKSVELQQWVYERNKFGDPRVRDTALWWGALIGITDQLELVLPIEFLWRETSGVGTRFDVDKYGAELRYRLTKMDLEKPDGLAPLLRFAVKRDILERDALLLEGDVVVAYQTGRFHAQIDLGAVAHVTRDDTRIELRPGGGVSIETKKGLRFGAEGFVQLFVDGELKKQQWAGVGPNMVWTTGRFWLTASFLIGVYQIETAPRVIWGVTF